MINSLFEDDKSLIKMIEAISNFCPRSSQDSKFSVKCQFLMLDWGVKCQDFLF
jgi:hypothetical protein